MKVGWPGLIIIEGNEEDCIAFYDEIRPMSWQYLVVRGEQQEVLRQGTIDAGRKFQSFEEVDDMSIVAQHCREVGLEALFRTSMKLYDSSEDEAGEPTSTSVLLGALVHVDHMNDAKNYRKWLRKTGQDLDCLVFIQQCYPNDDFAKRPWIIVCLVGENVSAFLKRWRTSRVDVDSKGRPCLERQMSVLLEGKLESHEVALSKDNWDHLQSEGSHLNSDVSSLESLLTDVGGPSWAEAFRNSFSNNG